MSQRSEIEDKYTVICRHCKAEFIEPSKRPNQKYLIGKCSSCGEDSR